MSRSRKRMMLGAIALVVGTLLPWSYIESILLAVRVPLFGLDGSGIIPCALGVILFFLAAFHKGTPGKIYSWGGVILSSLAGLSILISFVDMVSKSGTSDGWSQTIGIGFYISAFGAILGLVSSFGRNPELPPPTSQVETQPPRSR